MAIVKVKGATGDRFYDTTTGQRVEVTPHAETRSRTELSEARAKQQAKQPTGHPSADYDKFQRMWQLECSRHSPIWKDSEAGRRMKAYCDEESAKLRASREAQRKSDEFIASIADLVSHAERQYELVLSDETATVEECEQAAVALEAAKRGDRDAYVAWEMARHEQVTAALDSQAADYDAQARAAIEKRDAILASALEPSPVPDIKQVPKSDLALIAEAQRELAETRESLNQ